VQVVLQQEWTLGQHVLDLLWGDVLPLRKLEQILYSVYYLDPPVSPQDSHVSSAEPPSFE